VTGALTLVRALFHRIGTTLVILLVALCASAAATVGPTYYTAAKSSILQDSLSHVNVVGRSFQVVQQGPIQGSLPGLEDTVQREVAIAVGGAGEADRLFAPPITSLETNVYFPDKVQQVLLATRSNFCAHLRLAKGSCPTATNDVVIATSLARSNGWSIGDKVQPQDRPVLTITGIYVPPDINNTYWLSRGATYFPAENPFIQVAPYDALFTPPSTLAALKGHPQGTDTVARALISSHVQPADVSALRALADRFATSAALRQAQATAQTSMDVTADNVKASWRALAIPVFLVTAELLVLTWLLLFLVVTETVEARGTEVALAKLRGHSSGRALVFGLAEPAVLLAAALPLGAVLGWLLTGGLATVLLRDGTTVGLPGLAWVASLVASVGGVAAIALAARRTVTRPVVEQWRRTGRRSADRGWVFDAVVLTAAVAGLLQLFISGTLDSTRHSALALLVPGLLGIALAVVGSRLLPLACRAMFGRTRRGGGLGPFLAVRYIARRPGGTRTTMILATAVSLATFSLASWSVSSTNRSQVADMTVGAPTVFTVAPRIGTNLVDVVDRIDPGGRSVTAVESYFSADVTLLGVQPSRFAAVANWSGDHKPSAGDLTSALHPPTHAPIALDGDRVRVTVDVGALKPVGGELTLNEFAPGGFVSTPIDLGPLRRANSTVRYTADIPAPGVIRDMEIAPPGSQRIQMEGTVTVRGIEVHDQSGWHPADGAFTDGAWTDTQDQNVQLDANGQQLRWSFLAAGGQPAAITVHDHPTPLPALVSAELAGPNSEVQATGLNGTGVIVAVADRVPNVPSAPDNGVIVDLTYAERLAGGNDSPSLPQVWVRGPADRVARALAAAHVTVVGRKSTSDLNDELSRQGPGLASVLFLADAGAAAILAALAAVLSLSAAARRRRYEYAALAATGATTRSLYSALAIEQLVVIGFGTVIGVGAGLLAIALAGHSVPEFVQSPSANLITYRPDALFLGLTLGAAVVLLLGTAAAAAAALLRSVTPEQLREAPV
jgi:hypothetical protein